VRIDPKTLERPKEILEIFQSLPLKNHFEVLGVKPGCSDAEVKRAYTKLAKRYHPDVHRDPRLEDLHDVLEAIFIRVGEAWEVLGAARSRAS
jgi:curved DNA-binding protein CbpA